MAGHRRPFSYAGKQLPNVESNFDGEQYQDRPPKQFDTPRVAVGIVALFPKPQYCVYGIVPDELLCGGGYYAITTDAQSKGDYLFAEHLELLSQLLFNVGPSHPKSHFATPAVSQVAGL
jgi:hypothetical protein